MELKLTRSDRTVDRVVALVPLPCTAFGATSHALGFAVLLTLVPFPLVRS